MAFRDFLIARLLEFDPTLDPDDPSLAAAVLDPVDELLGEGLPQADPRAVILARLNEFDPEVDNTVFADLFGKPGAALFAPVNFETRASLNRRRLDDPRLLTGSDLQDLRDFFLVDTQEGGYARGVLRAFYAQPRSLAFDVTNQIVVPGANGSSARVFRPDGPQLFPVSQVRGNVSGGQYYVDIPVVATAAGEYYNLAPGEATGASGLPGASRVTNLRRFVGGVDSDTIPTFLARIRTALTLRSLSTVAGANHVLPQLTILDFKIAQGGDPRMVRDRIYGPSSISGIPGGFRLPREDIVLGDFVSLGVAYDIWFAPSESQQLVSVKIRNAKDEGVETMSGNDGTLAYLGGNLYTLTLQNSRIIEQVAPDPDNEGLLAPLSGRLRPVEEGDLVHFEGFFTDIVGERNVLEVTGINGTGTVVTLEAVDPAFSPPVGTVPGSRFRVLRPLTAYGVAAYPEYDQRMLSIPLSNPRAVSTNGDALFTGGVPVLTKPGSTSPEVKDGAFVPRIANVVDDVSSFPLVSVERLEILDPVTEQPNGDYIYPRRYLFAEFLESKSGSSELKATLLRVHLLGPQATAIGVTEVMASGLEVNNTGDSSTATIRMQPIALVFSNVVSSGIEPETDVLQIDVGDDLDVEYFHDTGSGVITIAGRKVQPGDWVHFLPTGSDDTYYFPIEEVDLPAGTITVSAPDIPSGLTGLMLIFQGASRASLLAEGRGPEGTYAVDIWLREIVDPGYTPGDPPLLNTKAFIPDQQLLTQGFELVSPLPGFQFSADETVSLTIQGTHVVDSQEIQGRSLLVHAFPGDRVTSVQQQIDTVSNRPMVVHGLAKVYPPAFVVASFYYDAESLTQETAAKTVLDAFMGADAEDRIELSDLVSALYDAGADFVVSGRIFVLRMDHNRKWESFASRGAVPVSDIGDFVLQAVTVTRLRRRLTGEDLDPYDSDNWDSEPYTLRPGGFEED